MTTLQDRADVFEQQLDSMRDKDGLVYASINAAEMRPWIDEDLKGYPVWDSWAGDFAGCLLYEDCLMGTGRYVSAKVLKHLFTGGDGEALSDAERSVRAILALSREGDKIEDGFLPKPFGGLSKASLSKNTSNDQYEHALFALWQFHQACPESALIPEIESAILRWTDYFARRDFSYVFHGYHWVCTDPTEKDDGFPVSVGRHSLGLYLPMCLMCYQITGQKRYMDAVHDRLLPSLRRWIARPDFGFSGHSNSCNLLGLGVYSCWRQRAITEDACQALQMCWEIAEKRLSRHDGLEYDYAHVGVSDDHQIEPHYMDRPVQLHRDPFGLWVSNAKGASSTTTAHLGALCEKVRPDAARRATVDRILNHFQRPEDFLRLVDADGRQLPPEHDWRKRSLVSTFIGAWLQAYYLMKLPREVDGL